MNNDVDETRGVYMEKRNFDIFLAFTRFISCEKFLCGCVKIDDFLFKEDALRFNPKNQVEAFAVFYICWCATEFYADFECKLMVIYPFCIVLLYLLKWLFDTLCVEFSQSLNNLWHVEC